MTRYLQESRNSVISSKTPYWKKTKSQYPAKCSSPHSDDELSTLSSFPKTSPCTLDLSNQMLSAYSQTHRTFGQCSLHRLAWISSMSLFANALESCLVSMRTSVPSMVRWHPDDETNTGMPLSTPHLHFISTIKMLTAKYLMLFGIRLVEALLSMGGISITIV
jgi:hypothetical protein